MRPTAGIVKAHGVIEQFPLAPFVFLIVAGIWLTKTSDFGIPRFFSRDISSFSKMISVSIGGRCRLRKRVFDAQDRIEILCPSDYLSTANEDETRVTNQFINGLEIAFQTERCVISIANRWKEDMPDGIENNDIAAYLKTAGIYPFIRDSKKGKNTFGGNVRDIIKSISEEKLAECIRRCEVYRDWLLRKIFEADSEGRLKVMVIPGVEGKANCTTSGEPEPLSDLLNGYASANMSAILQAPELAAVGM
ncbi:unnamed protein product [Clonostachys rhizophaga]|uniref:Uncharacterized protein n=1 Tax=Clonostachys rhizophaga TaxID=160324 RepID=A0A9N9VF27_9HYPO|nr:unnamed protein product [Clonostachys rhizophaga]